MNKFGHVTETKFDFKGSNRMISRFEFIFQRAGCTKDAGKLLNWGGRWAMRIFNQYQYVISLEIDCVLRSIKPGFHLRRKE